MPDETYNKIVELADNKDMTIQDTLVELVECTVNDDGNIVANTVKVKFGE